MKTAWQKEMLSQQPLEFEKVNPTTWIQRRNIALNEDQEHGGYVCESRFISDDVYETLMDPLYTPSHDQIMTSFKEVSEKQATLETSMVSIMDALLDVYAGLDAGGGMI